MIAILSNLLRKEGRIFGKVDMYVRTIVVFTLAKTARDLQK